MVYGNANLFSVDGKNAFKPELLGVGRRMMKMGSAEV